MVELFLSIGFMCMLDAVIETFGPSVRQNHTLVGVMQLASQIDLYYFANVPFTRHRCGIIQLNVTCIMASAIMLHALWLR